MSFLEKTFQLRERGTNVRTEVLAGATTFLTMAYIVLVNPAILSTTGMPMAGVAAARANARDPTMCDRIVFMRLIRRQP